MYLGGLQAGVILTIDKRAYIIPQGPAFGQRPAQHHFFRHFPRTQIARFGNHDVFPLILQVCAEHRVVPQILGVGKKDYFRIDLAQTGAEDLLIAAQTRLRQRSQSENSGPSCVEISNCPARRRTGFSFSRLPAAGARTRGRLWCRRRNDRFNRPA